MTDGDTDQDDFHALLDGVRAGNPTAHQIDPDERDPVSGETADEAEETLQKRGLVNPFHAIELQRRQNRRRRDQREDEPNPIVAELEREGFDAE